MQKNKCLLISIALLLLYNGIEAQGKFYTKAGRVSFYSTTPVENIEAINKSVVVLLDSKSGDLQFAVLMKGFEFKKALMQEHFNKDYVESDKFPRATFKGQLTNNSTVNYQVDGTYPVTAKGQLTIHGITKDIETSGNVIVKDGRPIVSSVFNITVADYQISIPKLYRDNISKTLRVTVECVLAAM